MNSDTPADDHSLPPVPGLDTAADAVERAPSSADSQAAGEWLDSIGQVPDSGEADGLPPLPPDVETVVPPPLSDEPLPFDLSSDPEAAASVEEGDRLPGPAPVAAAGEEASPAPSNASPLSASLPVAGDVDDADEEEPSIRPAPADELVPAGRFDDDSGATPEDESVAMGLDPFGLDLEGVSARADDGAGLGPDPLAAPAAEMATQRPDPFIGRAFAGYTIIEPIGQGGMGMVYKANQASLDRDVAIKMLNKALVDNEEFIKRFQREAKAMAHVHHPNIVSVIDFGEQDGIYFMVAEFVEGTNLSKLIREKLMVPASELVPIIVQTLSGLDYVARTGVVHRDIKPDNILIDKDWVAKLADFGLAKDFSKDETDLTAAGSAMGTPSYMSPEQCMGRPLDVRSDIYALGVTAYYALTGEKPFVGQSSFEIMMKQREHTPPTPHQINPQVPQELSTVVMQMLEKEPRKRFESAEACRDAWMTLGQEMGFLGSVTRSGEFIFIDPNRTMEMSVGTNGNPGTPVPPSAGVTYPNTEDGSLTGVEPALARQSARSEGVDPAIASLLDEPAPLPVANDGGNAVGSGPAPSKGRSSDRLASSGTKEASRSLRGAGGLRGKASSATVRPSEADRMFRQGNFRESAEMYAKLAESTEDRRQRSILRTKEREARSRGEADRANQLERRVAGLVEHRRYEEALQLLDRVRHETQSSAVGRRLSDEAKRIKVLVKRRRRLRVAAVVLLIVIAGLVALWFVREQWSPLVEPYLPPEWMEVLRS